VTIPTLLLATALATTACGAAAAAQPPAAGPSTTARVTTSHGATNHAATKKSGAAKAGGAAASGAGAASKPLAGKIVGIDPGHNGRNRDDPTYINRLIWNGRAWETCDTTGTETDSGYTEARFNFNVATFLRADLRKDGAKVVMTRHNNNGVGPCVNRRARILNRAHSNVAIDIHADGGPSYGRGFTVLEPVADGPNNKVIKSSIRFGSDIRAAMLAHGMHESNYYGHDGLIFRNDLAGLNLTTVPKILIECDNMRNSKDAALDTKTWFQKRLAHTFTAAIIKFLTKS